MRAAREAAGYTQYDLAMKTGLQINALSRMETGKADPSVRALVLICRALSVSSDHLLGLDRA